MACLIKIIEQNLERSVWVQLEEAARAVAKAYLKSKETCADGLELKEIFRHVNQDGRPAEQVELIVANAECSLVRSERMDGGEIRHQLRHVEVMLGVRRIVEGLGLTPTRSAPTQNSRDTMNVIVSDLEGADFAVEAYGGDCIANNSKDAKTLDVLRRVNMAKPGVRTFVAVRASALCKNTNENPRWIAGGYVSVRHTKDAFRIRANIIQRWNDGDYVMLEVKNIERVAE